VRFFESAGRGAGIAITVGLLLPLVAMAQVATTPNAPTTAASAPGYVKETGTMWTFDAPPLEYWKKTYGFTPDQRWLDHVRLASVRLPQCSASFVSARGLVLTNHHCARECVTSASPPDTDYNAVGYVARSVAEERRCTTLFVDQLQSIQDVTRQVQSSVSATTPQARVAQRDSVIDKLESACSSSTGLICQVVPLYQGGMYSMYRYKRYGDVRLVMVPEEAAAFFGGDPDNFTYPRYDLDMALLRVYENGAPMAVKDYFKWSPSGAKDGELVFVTGNPGSTGRLLTLAQMEYLRDVQYPATLSAYDRALSILRELSTRSEADKRGFENLIFGIENSKKAVTGYRAGLLDSTIMTRKAAFERDLRSRVDSSPALRAKYGGAWGAIATAERELTSMATRVRYYGFSPLPPFGSQLLNWAGAIVRLPQQSAAPDSARLPQYRGEGLARIRQTVLAPQPIDTTLEKLALAAYLTAAQREFPRDDPYLSLVLRGRSPEVAAEALVDGTKLASAEVRSSLVEGGAKAVAASPDPLIVLARGIDSLARPVQERAARLDDIVSANADRVGEALFAVYGTSIPPDATFTLRISDGVVKGYPMNGTIAPYKTTFYGMFGRSAAFDNSPPFHLPDRWMRQRDSLDLATPLDFVSTNDIIGGNSGSPVINRNAEVVGLIFDGNIESLPNRFIFTDEVARSVSVHSRAIVQALRSVYGAPALADELEGKGAPVTVK
jgi:hypothetical protein